MARARCDYRTYGVCAVALFALAGCARQAPDEMSWARAALERNDSIEILATDPQSRTFTVRLRDSGELRTVRVGEIVASIPPGAAPLPGAPPAAAPSAGAPSAQVDARAAQTLPFEPPSAPPVLPSSLVPQSTSPAETSSGHVIAAGPGYTIQSAAPSVAGASTAARAREPSVTNAALERRHEPIVCQGSRLLQIDNRNLVFDGDAVSAEDGCEIHITNTRISAGGIGVLARAANVHIDNSLIEGVQGSIDASEGAQVYAASSRFRGLSRRLDTAAFHDLGGNVWN